MLPYHCFIRGLEPLFPSLKIIGVLVHYEDVRDPTGTRWGLRHGQKLPLSSQWALQQGWAVLGGWSSLLA